MSLVSYPIGLKLPLLSAFRSSQMSNLVRTQMESGTARVRRRFRSVPTTMNASWRLKEQHAEIFEGFITYGTEDAINWFVMPIATPQGTTDHEVRFILVHWNPHNLMVCFGHTPLKSKSKNAKSLPKRKWQTIYYHHFLLKILSPVYAPRSTPIKDKYYE